MEVDCGVEEVKEEDSICSTQPMPMSGHAGDYWNLHGLAGVMALVRRCGAEVFCSRHRVRRYRVVTV